MTQLRNYTPAIQSITYVFSILDVNIHDFFLVFGPLDSVDPGVHRGHHRVPPGCILRLLHQTASSGPEGAGAPEGVRDASDGHRRHRLAHQLRCYHDPQHPV